MHTTLALVIGRETTTKTPRLETRQMTASAKHLVHKHVNLHATSQYLYKAITTVPVCTSSTEGWETKVSGTPRAHWLSHPRPINDPDSNYEGRWMRKTQNTDLWPHCCIHSHVHLYWWKYTQRCVCMHIRIHIYELRHMQNKIVTQGRKVTLVKVPQVYESSIYY